MTVRQKAGWTLAMFLSLGRIALGWVVVMRVWQAPTDQPSRTAWITLLLYCVAAGSDKADGFVSRYFDAVTPSGKFVDQLADKLMVLPLLYVCYAWTWQASVSAPDWSLWLVLLPTVCFIPGRIVQDLWSEYFYVVIPDLGSGNHGKNKTMVDMFGCGLVICGMVVFSYHPFTRATYVAIPFLICLMLAFWEAWLALGEKRWCLRWHRSQLKPRKPVLPLYREWNGMQVG
jgi:phosphatidylglycerophosphate synthase